MFEKDGMIGKFIRDKHGRVAIWQTPNIPLIGWFVLAVIAHFLKLGGLKTSLEYFSTAFLFTWAYLELTGGASYFRRVLGALVMLSIVMSHLKFK